tara:strand:+ start:816 stop:1073 length:258 start_codon:yes stop_codon:yes gene_type:complete
MFKKSLKFFYIISTISFIYIVLSIYFSKQNRLEIENKTLQNKSKSQKETDNLPVLKNDTNDIIIFNSEDLIEKKIKKRKIWELLN